MSPRIESDHERWLREGGYDAPRPNRASTEAFINENERVAEKKRETAKFSKQPFDRERALERADEAEDRADHARNSMPEAVKPCPCGCGYAAPTYGDPCPRRNRPDRMNPPTYYFNNAI